MNRLRTLLPALLLAALVLPYASPARATEGANELVNAIDTGGVDLSFRFCFQTTDFGASRFCAEPGEIVRSDYDHGPKNIHIWYDPKGVKRVLWINFDASCRPYFENKDWCDIDGDYEGSNRRISEFCRSAKLRDDGDGRDRPNRFTISGTMMNRVNGILLSCKAERLKPQSPLSGSEVHRHPCNIVCPSSPDVQWRCSGPAELRTAAGWGDRASLRRSRRPGSRDRPRNRARRSKGIVGFG